MVRSGVVAAAHPRHRAPVAPGGPAQPRADRGARPRRATHAGFEATAELRRSDLGLTFGPLDGAPGNVIKVAIDLQFVAPS